MEPVQCPCRRVKCKRHGDCAACREHHGKKGKPPACERENTRKRERGAQ